jgi:hypothetical protein
MSLQCNQPGCTHEWEQDPVLKVKCPNCHAPAGRVCRRPSDHQVWYPWGRFHLERDLEAARAGAYHHKCTRPCPETCGVCYPKTAGHRCARILAAHRAGKNPELF